MAEKSRSPFDPSRIRCADGSRRGVPNRSHQSLSNPAMRSRGRPVRARSQFSISSRRCTSAHSCTSRGATGGEPSSDDLSGRDGDKGAMLAVDRLFGERHGRAGQFLPLHMGGSGLSGAAGDRHRFWSTLATLSHAGHGGGGHARCRGLARRRLGRPASRGHLSRYAGLAANRRRPCRWPHGRARDGCPGCMACGATLVVTRRQPPFERMRDIKIHASPMARESAEHRPTMQRPGSAGGGLDSRDDTLRTAGTSRQAPGKDDPSPGRRPPVPR